MWGLRRASASHREGLEHIILVGTMDSETLRDVFVCRVRSRLGSQICSVKSGSSLVCLKGRASSLLEYPESDNTGMSRKFYHSRQIHYDICFGGHARFCSQAGVDESGKEKDEVDDIFSEQEMEKISEAVQEHGTDDEVLTSDSELSDDDFEVDAVKEPTSEDLDLVQTSGNNKRKLRSSELFKAIMAAPGRSIDSALDKYVKDGKEINRSEIAVAMLKLRQRQMYVRALQLSEWLEKSKMIEFGEREYASRLDLLIKVRGIYKGESYFHSVPELFRGELLYRTLLANFVSLNNGKKAEQIFNRMRELGFPLSTFSCNQMILLYTWTDRTKVADILLLMEKENIKPNHLTYRILIDTKGRSGDVNGMEQIVETMKSEGMEPDLHTLSTMAKHYVNGGLKDKALTLLKQMEGDNLKDNRHACALLMPLYASLGEADEVKRIWEVCEPDPWRKEYMSAIVAWGRLKNVDEAEHIFEKMMQACKKISSVQYTAMLNVYACNKMLVKGKELVKKMEENGCLSTPYTWDVLVKLYVDSGEVEKADSILHKVSEKKKLKPHFITYFNILQHYAKRGDIRNTEKIFHNMRLAGYTTRIQMFHALLQAYINSKSPAYGMRERLKADNLFPNRAVSAQLAQVDPFKKTPVSDLLD